MKRVYIVTTLLFVFLWATLLPTITFAATGPGESVCRPIPAGSFEHGECLKCVNANNAYTAIGCIEASGQGIFTKLFTTGIGIAGGIGLLLIVFGGFQILTSAGNPERLTEGKEMVQSAIAGLLLIIFSLFLLQLIGFRILGIPGFG